MQCKCGGNYQPVCDKCECTGWVRVEDRLPEKDAEVLVTNIKGWMHLQKALYYHDYKLFLAFNPDSVQKYILQVTHWLPIPQLPKE